ncbi:RNA methyltransferase [Acidipila sp. 4G-K13]|uniref:RNA methyltransferase n=2 Tax=Paracidobacterium acidisoli TaxID=2303751 RepID=A0A372ISN9_9BACT|nr:RNA methyltransferase [Paracidobacterium acidisoli]
MPTASDRSRLLSIVQSRQNARVKELRAGFTHVPRPGREEGAISIEGEHLVQEALRSGIQFHAVFVRSGNQAALKRLSLPEEISVIELTPEVFASAVQTETPQGIAALIEPPRFALQDVLKGAQPLVVVVAALQDPGNLGTLVRSAEAFGATGVVVLPGTVSVWNPKALRASSGSAFRLPVVFSSLDDLTAMLRENKVVLYASTAESGVACCDADLTTASAILIGNEGGGLPAEILRMADERITIPTPGPVESLNAGVAAGILLYEAARQRAQRRSENR